MAGGDVIRSEAQRIKEIAVAYRKQAQDKNYEAQQLEKEAYDLEQDARQIDNDEYRDRVR